MKLKLSFTGSTQALTIMIPPLNCLKGIWSTNGPQAVQGSPAQRPWRESEKDNYDITRQSHVLMELIYNLISLNFVVQ